MGSEKNGGGKQVDKLISIEFVCHGNICRSTMAEYVLKDMVKKQGIAQNFYIDSAGTSTEEIGNPVHYGTKDKLRREGIPVGDHRAVQLKKKDYETFDYLIGMEQRNVTNMLRILGGDPQHKVYRLLDFSHRPGDIADPWYTGNFDAAYEDVCEGCRALLEKIQTEEGEKR